MAGRENAVKTSRVRYKEIVRKESDESEKTFPVMFVWSENCSKVEDLVERRIHIEDKTTKNRTKGSLEAQTDSESATHRYNTQEYSFFSAPAFCSQFYFFFPPVQFCFNFFRSLVMELKPS